MLKIALDQLTKTVVLEPKGALRKEDFEEAIKIIDPFITKHGNLNGVIVYTQMFLGWDSFSAFISHLKFINDHHKKVSYVAFVTDSKVADTIESIGSHFVDAQIKHFPFDTLEEAKNG